MSAAVNVALISVTYSTPVAYLMALHGEKYQVLGCVTYHQGNKNGKSLLRYSALVVQVTALIRLLSDCGVQGKSYLPNPDLCSTKSEFQSI